MEIYFSETKLCYTHTAIMCNFIRHFTSSIKRTWSLIKYRI